MHLVCPQCAATNRVPRERLQDGATCGKCGTPLLDGHATPVTDAVLPRMVAASELPVLVDFWAAWCAPCRQMAPHFEAAARQLPEVRCVKVDSDAAPQSSARLGIRSIPTLVLFQGGQELARRSGASGAADILAWVRSQLGASARAG